MSDLTPGDRKRTSWRGSPLNTAAAVRRARRQLLSGALPVCCFVSVEQPVGDRAVSIPILHVKSRGRPDIADLPLIGVPAIVKAGWEFLIGAGIGVFYCNVEKPVRCDLRVRVTLPTHRRPLEEVVRVREVLDESGLWVATQWPCPGPEGIINGPKFLVTCGIRRLREALSGGTHMTPEQRSRIEEIEQLRHDLLKLKQLVDIRDESESAARSSMSKRQGPARVNELRTSLLRRSGWIQPLFERIVGRLEQPKPFNAGAPDSIWQIALHGHPVYSRAHYDGVLADELNAFIGRLEADPALLDPPKPAVSTIGSHAMQSQTNYIFASSNVSQAAKSTVSQTVHSAPDAAEMRRLLTELEDAIRGSDEPREDKDGYLESIEQIKGELARPNPRRSRLEMGLAWIERVAAGEGALQAVERAQRLAAALSPMLSAYSQALSGGGG